MFEVHVFIPVNDNDARTFDAAHHQAFEVFVVERFKGITRYPGELAGTWAEAGITYRDAHRCYGIALESITQGALIGEVAAFAKPHYRQHAIFIRFLGYAEVL